MLDRRAFLRIGVAGTVVQIAGCQDSSDDGSETEATTDDGTTSSTDQDSPETGVEETEAEQTEGSTSTDSETGGSEEDTESDDEDESDTENASENSSGLNVVGRTGQVTDDGEVGTVRLMVKKAENTEPVNLLLLSAKWSGPSGTFQLRTMGGYQWREADGAFETKTIVDADDDTQVISDGDREELVFSLGDGVDNVSFGSELPPGSQAEVTLITEGGDETAVSLTVPETLEAGSDVVLDS